MANLAIDSVVSLLQVTEKMTVGINSVNCTSDTFSEKTVEEIENGDYAVLYVVRVDQTENSKLEYLAG